MIYLITRHAGTLEWLQQQLIIPVPVVHLEHLEELDMIEPGDTLIGTLPVHLVAEVCRRGACFLYMEVKLPAAMRGRELTASQLTELGARLVEYVVMRPVVTAWPRDAGG